MLYTQKGLSISFLKIRFSLRLTDNREKFYNDSSRNSRVKGSKNSSKNFQTLNRFLFQIGKEKGVKKRPLFEVL